MALALHLQSLNALALQPPHDPITVVVVERMAYGWPGEYPPGQQRDEEQRECARMQVEWHGSILQRSRQAEPHGQAEDVRRVHQRDLETIKGITQPLGHLAEPFDFSDGLLVRLAFG